MRAARPATLHIVPDAEQDAPVVLAAEAYAYEAAERRHIASKDWAAIHVASDRRAPLGFFDRIRRTWR